MHPNTTVLYNSIAYFKVNARQVHIFPPEGLFRVWHGNFALEKDTVVVSTSTLAYV